MHNADSSLWIYGDSGHFARANREVLITDHPYLIQHFDQDTLVLFADTLYAIDDSLQANRRLRAYRRVSVYMKNLKAKADSLEYDRIDSTLHLYGDPVLWSGLNQLSGDTLHIWIVNQTADSLVADGKAFVISRNDSLFDDQVKGKLLRAKFSKEQMVRLEVEGNSESIYLVKDEKKRIGLNQSVSASLRVELADNEPKIIVFKEEPEATFYPIHEVWRSENRLDGYRWRIKEQPPVYYNTKPVNEKVPAEENQERPE